MQNNAVRVTSNPHKIGSVPWWQGRIPKGYWRSYEPDSEAVAINLERINKRLAGDKT